MGTSRALLYGNKIFFLIKCSACLMNQKKKYFKKNNEIEQISGAL